jgi:TetR/AcrR family transcriptional repressor of nem operon
VARPNQTDEQRRKLLPIVSQVFSELGYRRTTTAELAHRCDVRENILYRLWPDKKAMFLAAIDEIFHSRARKWNEILTDRPGPRQTIERLVAYEVQHQGEFGFYRIVFTALAESDDREVRAALTTMYGRFHELVLHQIKAGRSRRRKQAELPPDLVAWGLMGVATISNIIRELKLLSPRQRERMFAAVAGSLVEGAAR